MSFFKSNLDSLLSKIGDSNKSSMLKTSRVNKKENVSQNEQRTRPRPKSNSHENSNSATPSVRRHSEHFLSNGTCSDLKLPNGNDENIHGGSVDELDALLEQLSENEDLDSFERRNDREEIRRKLAMDSDSEEYYCGERVTRKPSLTTRLQSGMNLQICFMNETASDLDSQGSDQDSENGNPILNHGSPPLAEKRMSDFLEHQPYHNKKILFSDYKRPNGKTVPKYPPKPHSIPEQTSSSNKSVSASSNKQQETSSNRQRPSFFFSRQKSWRLGQLRSSQKKEESTTESMIEKQCSPEEDFLTRHARLQAEARHALSQAKEMARMQMEVERQRKKKSPIADIVGISFPDGRHRLSRQILTDMNVAQLQVIVNDLHSQIESLNEDLVRLLLERDDLNMEQDSMLVDIEDMTRFLGAKEEALKSHIVTTSKVAGRK